MTPLPSLWQHAAAAGGVTQTRRAFCPPHPRFSLWEHGGICHRGGGGTDPATSHPPPVFYTLCARVYLAGGALPSQDGKTQGVRTFTRRMAQAKPIIWP